MARGEEIAMAPSQLRACLEALRWSQRALAEVLGCDDRLVRRWASGDAEIPPDVGQWLRAASAALLANPPPTSWRVRRC